MPQTREHVLLAKQIGVTQIIVFLNKVDLIPDKDVIELAEEEIRELLTQYGFDGKNTPIIPGSALCAVDGVKPEIGKEAVKKLLQTCDTFIKAPARDLDKPFLMPIEHIYSIKGRGTVVTGKVLRGKVKRGDALEGIGHNLQLKAVVTGLESYHKTMDEAQAGEQVGLLLRGTKYEEIRRGVCMVPKDSGAKASDHLETKIYMLSENEGGPGKPIVNYTMPQLYSLTYDLPAMVEFADRDLAMPGEDVNVVIKLQRPMFVEPTQRFTMRLHGATLATGVIVNVRPALTEAEKDHKQRKQKMVELAEKLGYNPYGEQFAKSRLSHLAAAEPGSAPAAAAATG